MVGDYFGIHRSIWSFTSGEGKTLGVEIFRIPIEDFLLALFVPFWTIGLYEFFKNEAKKSA